MSQTTWELYVKSWKVSDPHEKRALFESALVPDCVYTDPLAVARGWNELAGYMGEFHRQAPGAPPRPTPSSSTAATQTPSITP